VSQTNPAAKKAETVVAIMGQFAKMLYANCVAAPSKPATPSLAVRTTKETKSVRLEGLVSLVPAMYVVMSATPAAKMITEIKVAKLEEFVTGVLVLIVVTTAIPVATIFKERKSVIQV
jgi:hypothetical protein